jgi:predicted ATPase/class 3 adenylate cyclase/Flp pilus assembly protein TadD
MALLRTVVAKGALMADSATARPASPGLPTGTLTFLFTDIEGSTLLWERYPEAMSAALARHDAILREAIEAHGGTVFKTVGDAFDAVFPTARDGVDAAIAAQRALDEGMVSGERGAVRAPTPLFPGPQPLQPALPTPFFVRMALHTGVAEERDGDYFGPPLNRIARLLATGHGGQVLLSGATQELVQDDLPDGVRLLDLGEHRLRDLVRPEHIYQLAVPGLPVDFPPLRTLDTLPNNLPVQTTSFVGREHELAEVQRLLASTHLLTLAGPGGIGKTRLAQQAAADVLDRYPDGVWQVELAPLTDPALLPHAVATALGIREDPTRPLVATLIDALRTKRVLLLLDNCEHLIAACAELAAAVLRTCPSVQILATSREPLAIAGETVHRVPPLGLPEDAGDRGWGLGIGAPDEATPSAAQPPTPNPQSLSEAERLFIERARSVQPSFEVTAHNAPAIAQICQRLDGIPLALELAAVQLKALLVETIAARLDDAFRLLVGGNRTALPRQRTLRALIDWSYDLLSEEERAVFRRLAVFAGGFTLEAAEAVCAGGCVPTEDVLGLLGQLVDKSLVLAEDHGGEPRYRLLATVNRYAAVRLEGAGETEAVREWHRDWYLSFVEQAEAVLGGPRQREWLQRLEADHDNLRVALDWSLTYGDTQEALRLAGALARFWSVYGHITEGRRWLIAALGMTGTADKPVRAKALAGAASLAFRQADYSQAEALARESLAIYRQSHNRAGEGRSLSILGAVARERGDYEQARALYEESLALSRALEDSRGVALGLSSLGMVALDQGEYARARLLSEEGLALFRTLGNTRGMAGALNTLGQLAQFEGEPARALALYEECLALGRGLGDKPLIAFTLTALGILLNVQGQSERAAVALREGLTLNRDMGNILGVAYCLLALGAVAAAQGAPERAARLFGADDAIRGPMGVGIPGPYQGMLDNAMNVTRSMLGEPTFAAAWAEGRAMPLDAVVQFALEARSSES